jgi:uncharacterized protein Ymh
MAKNGTLAGIEYYGLPGVSAACQEAVARLLQFGDEITRARILSFSNRHCLLLTVNAGDLIAVKSGFTSGYGGHGPRSLSYVLELMNRYKTEIDECEVDEALIERLDRSALTKVDVKKIETCKPIRPSRWYDYVLQRHEDRGCAGTLWDEFPRVIPFAIIDRRITDLAISFWSAPDNILLTAYRRLEDIVRGRTRLEDHGAKLFGRAFGGEKPILRWKGVNGGEIAGRISIFTGAYMAHRNPRAHQELESRSDNQLAEFLLLNHLYRLEREAQRSGRNRKKQS